jgi:hypothetical protein
LENYHVREWLNREGIYASSTITAFHGTNSYHNDKNDLVEFEDKKLTLHDCQYSIRIHQMADQTDQEYINKIRLIAKVCNDFADHLEGVENV